MTALDSVRRRWTRRTFVVGLLAAAALVVVGLVGSDAVEEPEQRVITPSTSPPPRALPPTPAGLLAIQADDGSLAGLVVLAQAPPGENGRTRGGTLLPLPAGAAVSAEGGALRRLGDVYAEGGIDALAAAAGELFSLHFTVAADVDRLNLGRLLLPVGSVPVTLPADVVTADPTAVPEPATTAAPTTTLPPDTTVATDDTSASGDTVPVGDTTPDTILTGETTSTTVAGPVLQPGERLLFAAGAQEIGAVDGADLLAAVRPGEAESVRFENSVAYWTAVAEGVGAGLTSPGSTATATSTFVASMFAGPLRVYAFRGTLVPPGADNPSGADLYRLDAAEVVRVIATVLPDAVAPGDTALTVQLINPTGDPALTLEAVERLTAGGATVVLVRELSGIPVPQATEWSLGEGTEPQSSVQPVIDGLGTNALVATGAPGTPHGAVEGVDVTVVLGKSFRLLVKQAVATTVPSGTVAAVTDPNTTSVAPTTGGGA